MSFWPLSLASSTSNAASRVTNSVLPCALLTARSRSSSAVGSIRDRIAPSKLGAAARGPLVGGGGGDGGRFEEENMTLLGQPQERRAQLRVARQIERAPRQLTHERERVRLAVRRRAVGEIGDLEGDGGGRVN